MARQEDTVQIDENTYLFTQLDPRRSAKVYLFLMSKIGGTVGKAIGAVKGKGSFMEADVNMKDLGDAVQHIFANLDDDATMGHIDTLLSSVLYKGKNLSLDNLVFQGKMLHMTKVVQKSVEVNYSDFLGESSGVVQRVKAMFRRLNQESPTSTGSSGDQSSKE